MTTPKDSPDPGSTGARAPAGPAGDDAALDRRLGAADPIAGALTDDLSTALVRRLAADVAAGTAAVRSRRRRRTTTPGSTCASRRSTR